MNQNQPKPQSSDLNNVFGNQSSQPPKQATNDFSIFNQPPQQQQGYQFGQTNPLSNQPKYGQPSYGTQPSSQYGNPNINQYPQAPYGQQPYGQPQYGQQNQQRPPMNVYGQQQNYGTGFAQPYGQYPNNNQQKYY